MADPNRETKLTQTLSDDQIVTERKVARRAFLTGTGVLLAGGAVAVIAGGRALAQDAASQQSDPDKAKDAKASDPDKAKTPHKKKTKSKEATDPDKAKDAKASDPDKSK